MKKTISAIALLASTSAFIMPTAFALTRPGGNGPRPKFHQYCLRVLPPNDDKSVLAGCDETANNKEGDKEEMENGCAVGQIALEIRGKAGAIESCKAPGFAQL